jgi:hypothetical protein
MSKSVEERLSALEDKVGTKLTTRVLIIQDKSSSMGSRVKETIDGYNEYISALADDDSDKLYLTLVQFDHEYEIVENGAPIDKVEPLDRERYQVRGSTAMLDAIGRGINELRNDMDKGDRAFVVIMTDGEENSSSEFSRKDINKLIDKCEEEGNWTFTFLGAGRDAWQGGEMIGLRRNQGAFYGSGAKEHGIAFDSLATTTSNYRSSNAMAAAATGTATSRLMAEEGAEVREDDSEEDGEE